uniref:Ataxin 7-like 1 n=1 Tax=Xiphophorus couchianus TaxID=32473 RepID=A0A3B5MK16_9TELE
MVCASFHFSKIPLSFCSFQSTNFRKILTLRYLLPSPPTSVSLPVVSLEKMSCLNRADSMSHVRLNSSSSSSSSSSTLSPLKSSSFAPPASQRSGEKLTNGRGSSGGPPTPRSITPPSSLDRVFDPDKHCGVPDPETKRSCTRSLTCKTHSLTQRRAVPGRSRLFDVLLAEHKGLAKEREALKEKEKKAAQRGKEACGQSVAPQDTASPSKPHCPGERPLSSVPGGPSSSSSSFSASSPLPPAAPPAVVPVPEPSPSGWANAAGDSGRLSSDEGDAETPDDADRPPLLYSSHHPRPSGFCVFSSRLVGPGYYVFDRRWDRMRVALQSMVEKHLNAQMWRRVYTNFYDPSLELEIQSGRFMELCFPVHNEFLFYFVLSPVFSRELGTSSLTYPAREPSSGPHQPMPPPSGPLAYGGGAEGRKRRSPSSYKGKSSKASRPGGLESLFGKGNDGMGILASGPESPRQVGGLQTATHRN